MSELVVRAQRAHASQSLCSLGTIGGFFRTFVLTPIELVKCRLQVQDGHAINNYSGPIDCAKHIYQRNGLRGLFLGQLVTMGREIPAMGAYFTTYEFSKRNMLERNMNLHSALIVSGGLAGIACWVVGYPQDGKEHIAYQLMWQQVLTLPLRS